MPDFTLQQTGAELQGLINKIAPTEEKVTQLSEEINNVNISIGESENQEGYYIIENGKVRFFQDNPNNKNVRFRVQQGNQVYVKSGIGGNSVRQWLFIADDLTIISMAEPSSSAAALLNVPVGATQMIVQTISASSYIVVEYGISIRVSEVEERVTEVGKSIDNLSARVSAIEPKLPIYDESVEKFAVFKIAQDNLNDHDFIGEDLNVDSLNLADNAIIAANKDAMQSVWDYLNKLNPRTLIDSGKCGANLYWELYSDGELKITGAGASYDFIKGVMIGKNRKSINKYVEDNPIMDYYGFHYDYAEFVGDGAKTSFNLANMPESVYFVMVDNVSKARNSEFTYNVETGTLTFNAAPSSGAKIKVAYPVIDNYYEVVKTFTGDGTRVRFSMEKLDVCNYVKVNGAELSSTEYAYDKLTGTLTFNAAPSSGANIEVQIAQYVAPWYRYRDERDWGGYDTREHYEISNPNHHIYNRININNGITYVGDWMFYRVCGPTKLEFPDSVKKMGIWCVRYTTTLRYLKLSKNLEEVGWYGISRNEQLLYIQFGDKLTKIGACSFQNNPLLERLDLPNSVTTLVEEYVEGGEYHDSSNWIYNCPNLQFLSLGSIDITKNNLYGMPYDNRLLKKVKMSENLTMIPTQSFVNSVSLESIRIPKTCTLIGGDSFYNCHSLKEVYVDSEQIAADTNVYAKFPACINLYLHKDIETINKNIPYYFNKIMEIGDYVWYHKKEQYS